MFGKGRYYSNIALYYLYYMGCRIGNKIKSCNYTPQGISKIWLLDYDDFVSLKFRDDGLYNNNLVTNIYHKGNFIELEASEGSKYTTNRQNGRYTHTLDTFVENFDFNDIADYDLASKSRKYLVVFLTHTNKYLMFGYKPGATFSYTSQTEEATGSLIQLSVTTTYPIFEVDAHAIADPTHLATYIPSPVNAYCETLNDGNTGTLQYRYMIKVSAINGEALDVNNVLCSISKKQQAVLILQDSPIITGYEIEGYYTKGAIVGGVPTFVFNPTICPFPLGYLTLAPEEILLTPLIDSAMIDLDSSGYWTIVKNLDFIDIKPSFGDYGKQKLTIKRKEEKGSGVIVFENRKAEIQRSLKVINAGIIELLPIAVGNNRVFNAYPNGYARYTIGDFTKDNKVSHISVNVAGNGNVDITLITPTNTYKWSQYFKEGINFVSCKNEIVKQIFINFTQNVVYPYTTGPGWSSVYSWDYGSAGSQAWNPCLGIYGIDLP